MKDSALAARNHKYTASSLLFVALIAVTFGVIFSKFPAGELWATISKINVWFLILGMGLSILFILFEGVSLQTILRPLGSPISLWSGFMFAATDIFYSDITPSATGGQPAMLYYMSRKDIPLSRSGMAALFNVVAYKSILLVTGTITVVCKARWINENGNWLWWLLIAIGFAVNVVLLVVCLASMFSTSIVRTIGRGGIRLLSRLHLLRQPEKRIQALENHLVDYAAGAEVIKHNRLLFWKVLGINLLQRLCMFSIIYCVYKSFGLSGHSYFDLIGLQILCALSVDSLPLPGGIGVTEGMTLALLSSMYPSPEMRVSAALLTRGINFYFCFLVCAATTLMAHWQIVKRSSFKEVSVE